MASNGFNTLTGRTANGMTSLNISRLNAVRGVMNTMSCDVMSTSIMYMDTLEAAHESVTSLFAQNLQVGGSLTALNASITSAAIGNLRVYGDISCTGNFYVNSTVVTVTDQFMVSNSGTGPALTVIQTGANDIATFYDDATPIMRLIDGGLTSCTSLNAGSLTAGSVAISNRLSVPSLFTASISVSGQISTASLYTQNLSVSTQISAAAIQAGNVSVTGTLRVNGSTYLGTQWQALDTNLSILTHSFRYDGGDGNIQYYNDYDCRQLSTIVVARLANHTTVSYTAIMQSNQIGHVVVRNQLSTPAIYTPSVSVSGQLSAASIHAPAVSVSTQLSAAAIFAQTVSVTTRLSAAAIYTTALSATSLSVSNIFTSNISVTTHLSATAGTIRSLTSIYESVSTLEADAIGVNISADTNNTIRINGHTAMGTNIAYTSLATVSRVLDLCYGPINTYSINSAIDPNSLLLTLQNANGNDSHASRYTSFNFNVAGYYGSVTDRCIGDISFVRDITDQPAASYYFKTRTNNTAAFEYRDIAKFGYSSCFISPGNSGPIVIGSQSPNTPGYNLCLGTPYGGTQTLELGVISTVVRGSFNVENTLSTSLLYASTAVISTATIAKLSVVALSVTTDYIQNLSATTGNIVTLSTSTISAASGNIVSLSASTVSATTIYNNNFYSSVTTSGNIYDRCGGVANETKRGAFSHYTLTNAASYLRIYVTEGATAFTSGAPIVLDVNIGIGCTYGTYAYGTRSIGFKVMISPWWHPINGLWYAYYQATSSTPNTTDNGTAPFTSTPSYGTATTGTSGGYRYISFSINMGFASSYTYLVRASVEVTSEINTIGLIDIQNTTS